MFNISSFLAKLSKNIQSAELDNEKIIETIEIKTQIKLDPGVIEIKNSILYVKTSPAIKNKLFIFKESILTEINLQTKTKIIDIR